MLSVPVSCVGVRRLPLPGRGDPARGALVAAVWVVVSRLEELLAERGVEVDHVTVYRWGQNFTPLLIEAARPCRHGVGDRWFVDETYVKVGGVWRYVYRAVDQHGQVIDVYVSPRRDSTAARRFFEAVLRAHFRPTEVVTDKAATLIAAVQEVIPDACHNTD